MCCGCDFAGLCERASTNMCLCFITRPIRFHFTSKAAKREDDEKREKEQEDSRASGLDPEKAAQLNQTAEKHWKDVKKRKNPDGAPSTFSLCMTPSHLSS